MWPFSRKKKQAGRRAFAGAVTGRLVSDWVASTTSLDQELRSSLVKLRNRSRQLERDNDYVKQSIRIITNNVVGMGIGMQSQVLMKLGGRLDEKMNGRIEASWEKWKRKENCDVSGKMCFSDIERLIMSRIVVTGEAVVRFVYQPFGNSKVPLALEMIQPDLLDETFEGEYQGNRVRMGVEINKWGRPVAYHFLAKHPGEQNFGGVIIERAEQRRRIPADEILHLFVPMEEKQTRGVPWLHSAVLRLHHAQGYEEAEVIGARAGASLMGFIESPEGELQGDDVIDGERVTNFEPGVFKKLFPGERVSVPNVARPNSQFEAFMRFMLRGVAAGAGVSYESVSRDYSQSNYSSSRLALLDDRDNWRVLQKWLIWNLHQPVFEKWMDLAVLSGELSIPDYEVNSEVYSYPRWMPRGWSWVDPTKEVAAYKDAVRCGFMTLQDVIAQTGGDFEDLLVQRKREIELIDEAELIFDTDPKYVSNAGLTQARPGGTALPNTDPDAEPVQPDKQTANV